MKRRSGAICDLRTSPDRRARRKCPYHKKMEYGEMVTAYDTIRVFLDCGTLLDYGYGYWVAPPKGRHDRQPRHSSGCN